MMFRFNYSKFILIGLITFQLPQFYSRIPDEQSIQNNVITQQTIPALSSLTLNETCFNAEPELCMQPNELSQCECNPHPRMPTSLVCCNVTDIEAAISCAGYPLSDNSSYWVNVHIRNATLNELDVSNSFWKRLKSMVITDGSIKKITKEFSKFSSPKCFNVSNNNLTEIYPRALRHLTYLQVLDMSYNNLSTMPNMKNIPKNLTLNIRGNSVMLCKSVLESMEVDFKFAEPDSTFCLINQTFYWFNSTEQIPLKQLERMKQLQTECPYIPGYGNCTCLAERMNYETLDGIEHLVFTAKVDCSRLGLIGLPDKLPSNTLTLNVSHNNITNLSAFLNNPTYYHILRLDADNNQISSMLELEGTHFIEKFEALFLRWNKLKSIPIYVLSNTLEKNPIGRKVYLEGNKLHCDCNSAKVLKLWLLARQMNIADCERISCENMPQKVLDLSELKLCQSQHDWTDYIHYLIAAEILLLMALIMKVTYDYWIFKTAGYLPWPASKMPKLPCDWLCES